MEDTEPEIGKVLIVSDAWHPQTNGVVRTYENLVRELETMGHDVKVIGPSDFPYKIPMPGYSEIKLALFSYKRLAKMISEYSPDYMHIATEGPLGKAARKYCIGNDLKFTTTYHTQFPDYVAKRVAKYLPFLHKPVHKFVLDELREFHSAAHVMTVATDSLEAQLKEWGFSVPMQKMTRGVDTEIFYPGEASLFKDLPHPVAIFVGRVAIEKNLEAFLDADWEGSKVIVGSGPDLEELRKKYPDAVFTGKKEGIELGDHYRSANIFAFPSLTDTFGMVMPEALACGIPIAAFNAIGSKDIVTDPSLGVLGDNFAVVAKKALSCTGDKESRFAHVKENYNWPLVARQFMGSFK